MKELILKLSGSVVVSSWVMGSGEADTEPGGSSGSCVDGGFEASRRACKALEHLLAQFKCCGCCARPIQTQRCSWAKPLALPKPISPQQHILSSLRHTSFSLSPGYLPYPSDSILGITVCSGTQRCGEYISTSSHSTPSSQLIPCCSELHRIFLFPPCLD